MIDISSLKKAAASLERAVSRAKQSPRDTELRDAVIQRFECTYELCWKMLKRQLEAESANPSEIDGLSFKDLLRQGAERGIVRDVEVWFVYRDQRNITAHVYDEKKAASVYQTACQFLEDAQLLLKALEGRQK
ncbi:MAG: nucleotidyltransferase [Omnitrophica bacterium RIFOXYB12_FULL_50_7]|nr:MAG: nucleotidyltransferase [Omnitrophica bacterium RIFOXYB12_FULL_50_7]